MKLYQSKNWLFTRYAVQKRSIEEIAAEAKCTTQTVYTYLKKFGIM
jgi:AcrR family transcriptional regulator